MNSNIHRSVIHRFLKTASDSRIYSHNCEEEGDTFKLRMSAAGLTLIVRGSDDGSLSFEELPSKYGDMSADSIEKRIRSLRERAAAGD